MPWKYPQRTDNGDVGKQHPKYQHLVWKEKHNVP